MARWLAKLKLSVRQPTSLAPSVSNAWVSSSSFAVVLTWLRCTLFAYQVQPISRRSTAGTMSW